MSLKDQIPSTEQGIINFENYCKSRLEEIEREKKRIYKQMEICNNKLTKIKERKNKVK